MNYSYLALLISLILISFGNLQRVEAADSECLLQTFKSGYQQPADEYQRVHDCTPKFCTAGLSLDGSDTARWACDVTDKNGVVLLTIVDAASRTAHRYTPPHCNGYEPGIRAFCMSDGGLTVEATYNVWFGAPITFAPFAVDEGPPVGTP